MLLPRPPDGFVGVTGVQGYLKALSFVAVLIDDLDFDFMLSSFTSSSSNALEYFLDMILNLSFFYARNPSFYMRSPFLLFFLCDIGRPRMKSTGTSMDLISESFDAFTGGRQSF